MKSNIRKYFEYSLFFIINIGLLLPIYKNLFILAMLVAYYISSDIFKISEDIIFYDDPTFLVLSCCFCLFVFLLKFIIFHLLYICKRTLPNIQNLFDKLKNNRRFLFIILIIAFLFDLLCFLIFKNIFSLFYGLLFNYASFLIFFKPKFKP